MQHLEGSGTPVLNIGPRFLKVKANRSIAPLTSPLPLSLSLSFSLSFIYLRIYFHLFCNTIHMREDTHTGLLLIKASDCKASERTCQSSALPF